jgi:hypothetical protein
MWLVVGDVYALLKTLKKWVGQFAFMGIQGV